MSKLLGTAVLLAVITSTGCKATPKSYTSELIFAMTTDALFTYRDQGVIEEDRFRQEVLPVILRADEQYDLAGSFKPGTDEHAAALKRLSEITNELVALRMKAETDGLADQKPLQR